MQGHSWDLVVTVCDAARDACPVLPGATMVHWGLPDPAGVAPDAVAEAFRTTADALESRIRALLELPWAVLDAGALRDAARQIHAAGSPR